MTRWYIASALWPNMTFGDYVFWSLVAFLVIGIGLIMFLTWPKPPEN